MFAGINDAAAKVHALALNKGWWDEPNPFSNVIANAHAELSEAWEQYRQGLSPLVTYLGLDGKPEGIPTEIADCIIRLLDYCAATGIDIEAAMTRKHLFNTTRPYRHGGKKA